MSRITAGIAAIGLVAASIVLGASPASAAVAFTVTTTADSPSAVCSPATTVTEPVTLRAALCAANNVTEAATVAVPAGTYTLTQGALVVGTASGADITVTGTGGPVLQGNGATQLMNLDPGIVGGVAVAISGLTFSGGVDNAFGGGAIIGGSGNAPTGDTLTVSDSTFTGNAANTGGSTSQNSPGGAIQFFGGALTLDGVDFVGNSSGTSNGGAVAYIAQGQASGERLSITGGSFRDNSVVAGSATLTNGGGALAVSAASPTTPMTITGTDFSGNTIRTASAGNPRAGSTILLSSGTLASSGSIIRTSALDRSLAGAALASGNSGIRVDAGAALVARDGAIFDETSGATVLSAATGAGLTIDRNYWGCNAGLATSGTCSITDSAAAVASASPRLLFSATATPTTLADGVATSTLATVVAPSSGTLTAAASQAFSAYPVQWTSVAPAGATVSPLAVGAISSTTYNRNGTTGAGSASVTLGFETATVQLTLAEAVAITSANSTRFQTSVESSFQVTASGYPAAQFATTGPLPAGITLSPAGVLGGTATASGVFPFTIVADNGTSTAGQEFTLTVGSPVAFTSPDTATGQTGAALGFTVTTSSTPTAVLSASGTLPTGVVFTPGAGGTATLTGTPAAGTGGIYPITITGTAEGQDPATQAFTLVVNQPAAVTAQPQPLRVNAGTTASFTATASGYPAPTVQWQADSGAGYVDVPGATSTTHTFTATQADDGTAYRAVFTNSTGSATSDAATLTVGTAPAFSSAASASFTVGGGSQQYAVTTSGVPDAVIATTGTLPAWLVLTPGAGGTAILSGTPPTGGGGVYSFGLTASNGFDPAAAQPFSLTVNEAPRIPATNSGSFRVGTEGTLAVTATTGYPAATTLASTGALPAGVVFRDNGGGSGTFVGTPEPGTGGTYTATVTASNSTGSVAQTVTITVSQTVAITAQPADQNVQAGATATFAAAASGFPEPGVQWQVSTDAGASFTDIAGATSATLVVTAAQSDNGNRYRAVFSNDTTATTLAATLTVGTAPTITSPASAIFTAGGDAQTVAVTATGTPAPTLALSGAPDWLTLAGGTLTAAPPADAGGEYTATLTASNGYGTPATQTLAITVNQAPVITSAGYTTFAVGVAESFTVTTTGFPSPSAISIDGALPGGVTLVSNGDGTATLAGTPAAGSGGSYQPTITASNGAASTTQSLVLTVTEGAAFTSGTEARFVDGVASSFTITTVGGFPATPVLTVTGTLPAGLSFVNNEDRTGTISGTPTSGAASVVVTVTADNGTVTTQQLTVIVDVAPVVTTQPQSANVVAGTVVDFTAAASGSPAPTVQWQSSTDAGASFADIPGATATTLSITAAQSDSGTLYRAVFSNGTSTVSDAAALTVGTAPVITSTDAYSVTAGAAPQQFTVTSTGVPAATLELDNAPFWLTIDDAGDGTATLAMAPPAGAGGLYWVTLIAGNGYGADAEQRIWISVDEGAAFTTDDETTFTAGTAGSFRVGSTGYPDSTGLTLDGTLPAGVVFTDTGDGDGLLAGTPEPGTGGVYEFTLTTTGGFGPPAVQEFTLTVNETISALDPAAIEVTTGVTGSTTITSGNGYPAASALVLDGELPDGLVFTDNGDGTATISGTPSAGATSATVTITATNAAGPGTPITLTITVSPAAVVELPADVPITLVTLDGVPAVVTQGQTITVSGGGFAAGAPVTVGIYSAPVVLARATAGADGRFTAAITIPADYLGAHSIVAGGISATGQVQFARADTTVVAVAAAAVPPRTLAATGPWDGVWLAGSLALLLALVGARMAARRRRAA